MEEAKHHPGDPALVGRIRTWAQELGFQATGIAGTDLGPEEERLHAWLAAGRHGDMGYMAEHGTKRSRPAKLVPGTRSVISVRMDYLPEPAERAWAVLGDGETAYISRYALGRDYHKPMRKRLQRLAERIEAAVGPFGYRAFVDSAPVLEKPLAARAGLGWVGKHSNVLSRDAGSWFFLGEIYTDLPLPADTPVSDHCGTCRACMDICPTAAITAPYELDARLCISYLTIEHFGPIPEALRPLMGNRIYGCDDCQLVCPWNRFARLTADDDYRPRHGLDAPALVALFAWDEATFLKRLEGSPIRRLGHERWLRNLAVALGNAPASTEVVAALRSRADHPSELVREHVAWALGRHGIGGEAR
ncbi:MAG TPA: tRNA epoxyqueuosine(34) reductase QueG [Gammaproteobacteria bacterium]|nr:tRNA epoxyqueuosine(34) reductase QueG [Gammaproteobacteria bacterium]